MVESIPLAGGKSTPRPGRTTIGCSRFALQLTTLERTCKLAAARIPASRRTIATLSVSKKTTDTPTDATNGAPAPDFEASLAELEAIVEKLEQGELSLDDSLKHFERGVQLTRVCQAALTQAEQKVEILLRKTGASGGDEFEAAPFDPDADES